MHTLLVPDSSLVKCKSWFRARHWSKEPILGPLENSVLFPPTPWYNPHHVLKLSATCASCRVTWLVQLLTCFRFPDGAERPCNTLLIYKTKLSWNWCTVVYVCTESIMENVHLVQAYMATDVFHENSSLFAGIPEKKCASSLLECCYQKWHTELSNQSIDQKEIFYSIWKHTCGYEPCPQTRIQLVLGLKYSRQLDVSSVVSHIFHVYWTFSHIAHVVIFFSGLFSHADL